MLLDNTPYKVFIYYANLKFSGVFPQYILWRQSGVLWIDLVDDLRSRWYLYRRFSFVRDEILTEISFHVHFAQESIFPMRKSLIRPPLLIQKYL
jgi:hypothetical protein